MRHRFLVAFMLALPAGCGARRDEPVDAPPVATPMTMAMARHDRLALEIRDGLVHANHDAVQRAGRALSAVVISPAAAEDASAMRAAASLIAKAAEADDLPRAGRAFGELAVTCSDCHARAGGPTRVYVGAPPLVAPTASGRMKRHAWAAEQLWTGIVFNSEPPWMAGAAVLADPALAGEDLVGGKTAVAEIDARARAVQRIGTRAKTTFDTSVRARMYGELIAGCAGCHERNGSGSFAAATYP